MIGFIILNYNTWNETINCINSLMNITLNYDYKIYVVDNASPIKYTDNQFEFLNGINNLEIICANENKGYSAGNNIGLKKALDDNCDYYAICNSDILFIDNSLNVMIEYLDNNTSVGIVGPQIYNINDELQDIYMKIKLDYAGKIKHMLSHVPLIEIFSRSFEKKFVHTGSLDKPLKVFGVSGCFFIMSKECCRFLCPLDENTFLYEEEYIIGCKLENSKFEVYVLPDVFVKHIHGISTGGMTPFSYSCLIESEQYYLKEYLKKSWLSCEFMLVLRKIISYVRRG